MTVGGGTKNGPDKGRQVRSESGHDGGEEPGGNGSNRAGYALGSRRMRNTGRETVMNIVLYYAPITCALAP